MVGHDPNEMNELHHCSKCGHEWESFEPFPQCEKCCCQQKPNTQRSKPLDIALKKLKNLIGGNYGRAGKRKVDESVSKNNSHNDKD